MAQWFFSEIRPSDKTREPIQGEFFTNDAIGRYGEALVREGIQNALDAGCADQRVHIRIFVSGPSFGVPHDTHERYFNGVWPHLHAEGNGLINPPKPSDDCPFIVFEDFGTIGLEGDVEQYYPVAGQRNPFYHFVRAEGRSDKGEHERGRWGVGKFVFPRSSQANTVMCATVRADDCRKLLIGQTVLKTHAVDGKVYTPDGFFGEPSGNGLTLPIEDDKAFRDFCQIFNLERRDKPGLSIVMPWHDAQITADALIEATVIAYFYPIMAGQMTVSIETPDEETLLASTTLDAVVNSLGSIADELKPFLRLARSAAFNEKVPKLLSPPNQKHAVRWSVDMVSDDLKSELNQELDKGNVVATRVPLKVRRKAGEDRDTFFDIYLCRDSNRQSGRPIFVREGIIISDVQARRSRGIRSLVIIEDGPLATLLGDAENPSHTRWENGSNFKNKYVYGKSFITFVTHATSELLQILADSENDVDRTLLSDFFSLPENDKESGANDASSKPGKKRRRRRPPPRRIPPSPPRFRVSKHVGGCQLTAVNDTKPPEQIDIKFAYDVRRGSALRNYDTSDFQIGKDGVAVVENVGVSILKAVNNQLTLRIVDPAFKCTVTGFDSERDLYIDARAKDKANDD